MNDMLSIRWTTPNVLGVVAAILALASSLARANEVTSVASQPPEVERRVQPAAGPKDSGLIPGVLIGPRLSLLALPTPSLGVEARFLRYFGVSFDYGLFPTITINDVSVSYNMWNVAARVYPWGNAFFVGAVYGHYGVEAVGNTPQGSGSVKASSDFIGPQIGARFVQSSGFFIGVDLAWAFPLSYHSEASPDPSGTTLSIKNSADRWLQHGIPLVGLVSVGWLF